MINRLVILVVKKKEDMFSVVVTEVELMFNIYFMCWIMCYSG